MNTLSIFILILISSHPIPFGSKGSKTIINKRVVITKETFKRQKLPAYFYEGNEVKYVRKFKQHKKQKGSILGNQKQINIVKEIYNLKWNELEKIEKILANNPRICDHGFPFIIQIYNKDEMIKEYKLIQYTNCYPNETKEIMEKIELLF